MFSLMLAVVLSSSEPDLDIERIRSHLKLVEDLLRAQHAPDAATEAERLRNLDALHAYWLGGLFPHNVTVPGARSPIFIDHLQVACAAGALIIASGERALAERVSATMNEKYLDEMHNPELDRWVEQSGLTLGELRLIQPTYTYRPRFQEPLLEAAYLGDLPKVKALLAASKDVKADATEVLRAAALSVRGRPHEQNDAHRLRPGVFSQTRWVGDGFDVMRYALSLGADINDTSKHRPTPLFEARDIEIKPWLVNAGAKFTLAEKVLVFASEGHCAEAANLVLNPQIDFSAQQLPRAGDGGHCSEALSRAWNPDQLHLFRVRDDHARFVTMLKRGVLIEHAPSLDAAYELLLAARKNGQADDVRVLEGAIASTPALYSRECEPTLLQAVKNADLERIDIFTSHNITLLSCPDQSLSKRLTAFEQALTPAQLKTLELSLRAGLDVNEGNSGEPLKWAIEHDDTALAAALFERGARPSGNTGFDCSLLSLAVAHNNVAIVKMMMAHQVRRATEFDASPRCPGTLRRERPRPVDTPKPGQGNVPLEGGSRSVVRAAGGGPPKITVVDMQLSPEMKAVLRL